MPAAISAPLPADLSASHALLQALLDVSLIAFNLLRPVYGPDGELTDFTLDYLNPVAQRMTGLTARPGGTLLIHFPDTLNSGVFDFYKQVFETSQPGRYDINYQADGLDNYFKLAARHSGELLVVSFTDTADQDRTPVELALRESQAAEKAARAETEAQRQRFYDVLMQLPAQVAIYHGPDHIFTFVNQHFSALVASHELLGRPVREAAQGAVESEVFAQLDRVYATGEAMHLRELKVTLDRHDSGQPEPLFVNASYLPLRDAQDRIHGVLDFSYDVTEQVRARQQLEKLNQELEARVRERTATLQASETRFRHLVEQAPVAIALTRGPNVVIESINAAMLRIMGKAVPEEVLGKAMMQVLPHLESEAILQIVRTVMETGEPFRGDEVPVFMQAQVGEALELRYFDVSYTPLRDGHEVRGLIHLAVDVTEQVRARQRAEALQAELLAAAERRAQERDTFYQVFAETPAAICIQRGPEHRYEYVNAAYQAFFPGREFPGRTVAEALPETVEAGVVALLDNVYKTGETYFGNELPLLIAQPEGPPKQMYFTFTYQAYRENDEIVGISTFAYDVAEQVLARQDREAQQRQLSEVFEQAPVAICVFQGPEYVLDVVNPPMVEMLGRPLPELLGRPFFVAMPELTDQGVREMLDGVRLTGEPFAAQEREVRLERHGPDETGFFNFVYQPLRDEHGQVSAITCVAIEVTEQLQARERVQDLNEELAVMNQELAAINEEMQATNEELNESNHQLTRTNVDLDNFIYTASHDLKAPISNIEGLLHALLDHLSEVGGADEMTQPILEMMQGAVDRFKQTIDHLTDITKLQQEHTQPTEQVDLATIIEDVRLDLLPLLDETDAHLEVAVTDCPTLAFSAKNLRSLIYNLLSNALKYRHPDRAPYIRIHCQHEGGRLLLRVADNGLGLSEAQQAKLFGMFQRLHTHVEGSGIGLYMVKKMVENAGGKIAVESQPGVGSTFLVSFPA